jgi:hypothetical protein
MKERKKSNNFVRKRQVRESIAFFPKLMKELGDLLLQICSSPLPALLRVVLIPPFGGSSSFYKMALLISLSTQFSLPHPHLALVVCHCLPL